MIIGAANRLGESSIYYSSNSPNNNNPKIPGWFLIGEWLHPSIPKMSRDVHKEAHQIIDDDSIYVPPLNYDSSDRAMNGYEYTSYTTLHCLQSVIYLRDGGGEEICIWFILGFQSMYGKEWWWNPMQMNNSRDKNISRGNKLGYSFNGWCWYSRWGGGEFSTLIGDVFKFSWRVYDPL